LLASGRPLLVSGDVPAALGDAVRHAAAVAEGKPAANGEVAPAPRGPRRRRQAAQDYHEKERVFRRLERNLGLRPAPTLAAATP
jgi:hypothetical protein